MDKQQVEQKTLYIRKFIKVVRKGLREKSIHNEFFYARGSYNEIILMASVLFELGIECNIKFGDAMIIRKNQMRLKILTDDLETLNYWMEISGKIIDFSLGIMADIDWYRGSKRMCRNFKYIAKERCFPVKIKNVFMTYRSFSFKNIKELIGGKFCNNNNTLYTDLNVDLEFIALAKELADKYRLVENIK